MDISQEILSDITVYMKYAKYDAVKMRRETWDELVTRNMNMHIKKYPQIENEIREVYKMVFDKKILPSMRSLQFGGKPIEISPNRIYNCAYLPIDHIDAFSETMFLLLGGTGVGYSVQKHHVEELPEIRKPNANRHRRYLIGDSIEGWADAIKVLLKSYVGQVTSTIQFDYSDIRPKGERLVTSGGKAPGPQPLKDCIHKITSILDNKIDGEKLSTIEVHDIICHIADAVLSGGIRRAALISLFSADDDEMIACKSGNWWELNPQRGRANNSAVLVRHKITEEFFMGLWERIKASGSGEPGIYLTNDKDWGTNPCCEIALRPFQFCNLCEVNVSNIESQEDFNNRVKAATFIGTLQAGYTNFHYLRDIWRRTTEKDALIGVGMTGIGSGTVLGYDMKEAAKVCKEENARIAELIGINKAARTTTVKPSGCMEATTKIKTNLGVISLEEIFKVNEYDIDEFKEKNNIWLNPTQKIYVKDKNNDDKLITKLYVNGVINDLIMIEFENGDVVKVTPNHKFLTKDNGWVRADELTENHEIINY
jgi:ribonucleoside-diphosphate reductase alpha chain